MGLLVSSYLIEFGTEEQSCADDLREIADGLRQDESEEETPPLERQNAMIGESEFSHYFNAMSDL